jgi:hypothetical protein
MAEESKPTDEFKLTIVYGINKKLDVTDPETILEVKMGALELFGIEATEIDNFVLRAKIKGEKPKDEQLDEAKTVAEYGLRHGQKVTLASGTPFGARRD